MKRYNVRNKQGRYATARRSRESYCEFRRRIRYGEVWCRFVQCVIAVVCVVGLLF